MTRRTIALFYVVMLGLGLALANDAMRLDAQGPVVVPAPGGAGSADGNDDELEYECTPTAASSPSSVATFATVTIPGGTLGVGDRVRIESLWEHTGTVTAPRSAITFGGQTLLSESLAANTDAGWLTQATVYVTGTDTQRSHSALVRPTLQFVGGAVRALTVAQATDIAIVFQGNFNAVTADTMQLNGCSVEVIKG
jgi:hypothetical protein